MTEQLFFLVSTKNTQPSHLYITFWRPNDAGYCWPLSWAGKYSRQKIQAKRDYYMSDNTFPVPCEVVDAIASQPLPGMIDGDAGPVVENTKGKLRYLRTIGMREAA